jgi:hypothetical protein
MLPDMGRFVIASILLASALSRAAAQSNTLNLPKGWDTWPLTEDCNSAVSLYVERANRAQVKADSKANWYYFEGQTAVDVRDEEGLMCAMVQVEGVPYRWGWVPYALLLKPTPAQIEEKERTTRAAAEGKARFARAAYLGSLPIINNGNAAIFIGSDRKCSEQFVQAISMDGLEKRKKMAELVTFGCGYLVDAGIHVKRIAADATYCRVEPAEGKQAGKSGWVPCSWVKYSELMDLRPPRFLPRRNQHRTFIGVAWLFPNPLAPWIGPLECPFNGFKSIDAVMDPAPLEIVTRLRLKYILL